MNSLLKGTFLLIIATFLGEVTEFIVNMILARELGESGLGQYMTILPTIFLVLMLASFELPVSVSKMVAENDEKYYRSLLGHAVRMAILITAVLSIASAVILPLVPAFKGYHPMFKWVVLLLIPVITISSVARGFFMGKNEMGKIAVAYFLRRIIQLLLLALVFQFFEFDPDTSLLVAFCTMAGSELVVFTYLLHLFIVSYQNIKKQPGEPLSGPHVRKSLMAVSVPTTAMRLFNALTHAVQPFLIKAAVIQAGISPETATEQYGMLAGVAMTIGFFPAFIAHSFLIILIPAVSKAYAQKEFIKLQKILQQVMLITFIYGIPAVVAFYVFAEPLTNVFFHSSDAAIYLQLLAPYFLFHFFVIPMQAYLIGLGLVKDAFIHTVWATIISFSLIWIVGSQPEWHMGGIIIGMNAGSVLLTLLHYITICKKIGITWPLKAAIRNSPN
ncbi:polysaccharide biosynthesis protein [Bacillus sp. T33-2]|uniref:polysaccharide biosynthesis protein n=1 Tax=Bacillus sp. T33-2 TaxID=2054168 RepID=UPI000C76161E|nr:polysaccharide biosynthesis protein [Bacillus sp. T33-2]PLR96081.1 multidrug transporter MatE [Bacillus sp. T33-2]